MKLRAALIGAAFLFYLTACSSLATHPSSIVVDMMASDLQPIELDYYSFDLVTYARGQASGANTLDVYIEGDGAAWSSLYHPPRDPTPKRPIALELAIGTPAEKVAYLGRPCQYLPPESLRHCDSAYWINKRFAPEVIAEYDHALDQLKSIFVVNRLRLIGYSGGGVIATLLAAHRSDIDLLITVASPLALTEWAIRRGITPLSGSLDPDNVDTQLPRGVHFVGGRDKVVPPGIVERFVSRHDGHMEILPDFDHNCCWARDWKIIFKRASEQVVTK